jgi:hypothetical protein
LEGYADILCEATKGKESHRKAAGKAGEAGPAEGRARESARSEGEEDPDIAGSFRPAALPEDY